MKTTVVLSTHTRRNETEYFVLDPSGKPLGIIRKQHRRQGDGPRRHQWYAWVYPDRAIPGDGGVGIRPIEGTETIFDARQVIKKFHVDNLPGLDEGVVLDEKYYTDKDGGVSKLERSGPLLDKPVVVRRTPLDDRHIVNIITGERTKIAPGSDGDEEFGRLANLR